MVELLAMPEQVDGLAEDATEPKEVVGWQNAFVLMMENMKISFIFSMFCSFTFLLQ